MKNTTANKTAPNRQPRRRREAGMGRLWVAALALNLAVLVPFLVWSDLRRSDLSVQPKTEEEMAAELKKREELAKRPKPELKKEDVERGKEHIEKRKREELKQKIKELEVVKKEIEELKDEQIVVLKERDEGELLDQLAEAVRDQAEELLKRAEDMERSDRKEDTSEIRNDAQQLKQAADQIETATNPPKNTDPARKSQSEVSKEVADLAKKAAETSSEYAKKEPTSQSQDIADRAQRLSDRAASLAAQEEQAALDGFSADQAAIADNMDALSTDEMYDQARQLEQQIAEQFADSKAAELALTQDTSFQKALEAVSTPGTVASDLGDALNQQPQTRDELAQFAKSLDQAVANAARAAENARNQLAQAQGRQDAREGGERSLSMQAMQGTAALNSASASASLQNNSNGMMVDMTSLMAQAYGGQGEENTKAGSNKALGGEGMSAMSSEVKKERINLDANRIKAQALPGRKFSSSSERKGWLFVDSWYVVGPFENRGKIDYSVRHPPETNVDFDAEYVGKNGKELKWNYIQSNVMRINPPDEQSNSTYYCYTDVHFEEDTDMLLAVASDDAAKVWINDIVVWQDTGLSAWQLDEGFRKVRFKKGYNKILVRIENGPVVCYYSLLLCPTDLR